MPQSDAQTEAQKSQSKQAAQAAPPASAPTAGWEWAQPESWTRYTAAFMPPSFTPGSFMPAAAGAQWLKACEEQLGKWTELFDEAARTEKVVVDRAHGAVHEASRLALASIDYGARFAGEWRRGALEAGKRGLEWLRAR